MNVVSCDLVYLGTNDDHYGVIRDT